MKEETTEDKQLKTEVTSVAQEEEKSGVKIETPDAETLAARASMAFFQNRRDFMEQFKVLSARAKTRVINAVLDLPTDGVPVYLKNDVEKKAFDIGQRVIADRFIITQHHIVKEVKKQRAAIEKAKAEAAAEESSIDSEKTLDKDDDKS